MLLTLSIPPHPGRTSHHITPPHTPFVLSLSPERIIKTISHCLSCCRLLHTFRSDWLSFHRGLSGCCRLQGLEPKNITLAYSNIGNHSRLLDPPRESCRDAKGIVPSHPNIAHRFSKPQQRYTLSSSSQRFGRKDSSFGSQVSLFSSRVLLCIGVVVVSGWVLSWRSFHFPVPGSGSAAAASQKRRQRLFLGSASRCSALRRASCCSPTKSWPKVPSSYSSSFPSNTTSDSFVLRVIDLCCRRCCPACCILALLASLLCCFSSSQHAWPWPILLMPSTFRQLVH